MFKKELAKLSNLVCVWNCSELMMFTAELAADGGIVAGAGSVTPNACVAGGPGATTNSPRLAARVLEISCE